MSAFDTSGERVTTAAAAAPVVVIGAGPAGLTAALDLARLGISVVVVEAGDRVGGLSQTVEYKGFRVDIGGHRFFTRIPAVRDRWRSMLGSDFLRRPRLSRIYYDGKFFNYPLKPVKALLNLGVRRSIGILASYLWIKLRPIRPEASFEDWVSNRFGRRLYRTFFETYTEKVWGIPGRAISARWAAQRIQNFSLGTALIRMLTPTGLRGAGTSVKTLIDEFEYPRLGPGMMWEAFTKEIERLGGRVLLKARVNRLVHDGHRVTAVEFDREGERFQQPASSVISTMPLRDLVESLGKQAPVDVRHAGRGLHYRDFITVALILDQRDVFPDNWIYIHDASVKMGRIQNFKNWSPDMVPDSSKTCLGLEYFCTTDDELWTRPDEELVKLATQELGTIGLADSARVVDGTVVRASKAYPIYDESYADAVQGVREYLQGFANLQTIGRGGTHTYNNQDHSMVMGMLAARNLLGERHDLWTLNTGDEYLEDDRTEREPALGDVRQLASTQPLFPTALSAGARGHSQLTATRP
jgi:protoporphyrinogen oxidase